MTIEVAEVEWLRSSVGSAWESLVERIASLLRRRHDSARLTLTMTEGARKLLEAAFQLPVQERADIALKLITTVNGNREHPDEYVILSGPCVIFHSANQLEALARYAELLDDPTVAAPQFLPPRAPSRGAEPVVRGRAISDAPTHGK